MFKASIGALAAIVAVALITSSTLPVQAFRVIPPGGGSPGGTSSQPSNPNSPGGTDEGDQPLTPEEQLSKIEDACNGALATLVKIPEKMVVSFDNEPGVNVVPICSNGMGHQAKIDASQAMPLQTAIANNPALMAALKAKGFTADDVVGVVLLNGAATLYVHKHA